MRRSRLWLSLLLSLAITGPAQIANAQEATPGSACTVANAITQSGGPSASGNYLLMCNGSTWVSVLDFKSTGGTLMQVGPDSGSCTAAKDGRIKYTSTSNPPYEYCDGGTTTWRPFRQPRCTNDATGECYLESPRTTSDADFTAANIKSGTNIMGVTGSYSGGGIDTVAGYFVLTNTVYTASSLGGMNGADAACLTEVQGANWRYKSDAGTITAGRVRSFLCNQGFCNDFAPNAAYFFARAGSTTVGGLAFKTDTSGNAPGFSETWAINNYHGATAEYFWSGRAVGSASTWGTTGHSSDNCSGWYSNAANNSASPGGPAGWTGYTNNTGTGRWNASSFACSGASYKLICMVHPPGFTPATNPCTASATTYNTPGTATYTVPAGCTTIRIEAFGAGGGGGAGNGTTSGGGGGGGGSGVTNGATVIVGAGGGGGGRFQAGGGGGGYAMAYHSVASGTNLSVIVGGGGASTCTITGGNGGSGDSAGGTGGGDGAAGANASTRWNGGGAAGGRSTAACSGAGGDAGGTAPTFGGGGGVGGSSIGCYGVGGDTGYGGPGAGGSCGGTSAGVACNGSAGGAGAGYAQETRTSGSAGSGANGGAAANSGPGTGGTSCGANGGNGRVVITPMP